jgi:hypothetical protein
MSSDGYMPVLDVVKGAVVRTSEEVMLVIMDSYVGELPNKRANGSHMKAVAIKAFFLHYSFFGRPRWKLTRFIQETSEYLVEDSDITKFCARLSWIEVGIGFLTPGEINALPAEARDAITDRQNERVVAEAKKLVNYREANYDQS